jgi:hypothetical protein
MRRGYIAVLLKLRDKLCNGLFFKKNVSFLGLNKVSVAGKRLHVFLKLEWMEEGPSLKSEVEAEFENILFISLERRAVVHSESGSAMEALHRALRSIELSQADIAVITVGNLDLGSRRVLQEKHSDMRK